MTAQNGESIGRGIADPCGPKEITLKDKDVSKEIFSKAAVFFIISAVSLTLMGWGFTGNSTKAKDLRGGIQAGMREKVIAEE